MKIYLMCTGTEDILLRFDYKIDQYYNRAEV